MKLRLVLAALILLRATSSGAQADPRPEARGLAKQASTAYERGDLQSAARLYEEAYHLLHNDQIQYSLGRVYEGQGQLLRAKQAYERFIKGVPEADRDPGQSKDAWESLRRVSADLLRAPVAVEAQAQRQATLPNPGPVRTGRPALRAAGFALLGVAALGLTAGISLWALDGLQRCEREPGQVQCPEELSGTLPGALLVAGGALLAGGGALLLGLDARGRRAKERSLLTVRF